MKKKNINIDSLVKIFAKSKKLLQMYINICLNNCMQKKVFFNDLSIKRGGGGINPLNRQKNVL